jgi:hypothetical protein
MISETRGKTRILIIIFFIIDMSARQDRRACAFCQRRD